MIIIKLEGGLGNQMFQYAFVSILAKKINNLFVFFDKSSIKVIEKKEGFTPRNYEQNIFNDKINAVSEIELIDFFKIVVAPRKWFSDDEKSPNDLIPPQWIRL